MTPAAITDALDDAETLDAIWQITRAHAERDAPLTAGELLVLRSTFYCGARGVLFMVYRAAADADPAVLAALFTRLRVELAAELGEPTGVM